MNNDLEYMREIYRFLPPGVDSGLDFTPLIFCDSYEKFRSEVWFYEEILGYDIIKQEDDKCLLWNGEEYVIILYAHLKVKEASGKEPVESRGLRETSHIPGTLSEMAGNKWRRPKRIKQ